MTTMPAAPSAANPDLVRLHSQLIALARTLDAAIGAAASAAQVSTIANEITEVNARVTNVGRQLLQQQTATITKLTAKVTAAIPAAEHAVAELADVKAFVDGITGFLKLVDQAVDAAKLII